jgi:L-rhamnose mutarotase
MIRKAFVMQVNPDAHEEYQRRHNPIWPELEAVLKAHGAHHYAIYLDKERHLLFATVEIDRKSAGTRSPTPRCASAGGSTCAM